MSAESRQDHVARLHAEGAKEFGDNWMVMNRRVLNIARNHGADVGRQALLFTGIALLVCRGMQEYAVAGSPIPEAQP